MPKKAKKGGRGKRGKKKEKLTPEQKEELRTEFLKDELQKEKKATTVNLLKINQVWRSALRQVESSELCEDIDILKQTFDRQLEDKDNVIEGLQRDLEWAELQSTQVSQVHLQKMERLGALQEKQMMLLKQRWEERLQCSNARFTFERDHMLAHSLKKTDDLEDAKLSVEQEHRQVMNEIHRLYNESIASSESAYDVREAILFLKGGKAVNDKSRQNHNLLELQNREAKELEKLVQKNQRCSQMSEKTKRRVEQMQDQALQLRIELKSRKSEKECVERDLPAARNKGKQITHKFRDQLTQSQSVSRKQLTDLTLQSNNATKKLQAVIAKGNRVLRAAELCRKLESKQKNVFMSLSLAADHPRSVTEEEESKRSREFPELWHLMRHKLATQLQRDAMKKCNSDLSRENQELRRQLCQLTDTMMVRGHSQKGHHALLAVQQAPTSMAPCDTAGRQTVRKTW